MSQKDFVFIDARAAAYEGDPVRILGVTDSSSGKIIIQKVAVWNEPVALKDTTIVVTDTPNVFKHWGLAFDEDSNMKQVLNAYKEAKRASLVKIDDELRRYEPDNVIQMRKFDERGAALEFDSTSLNNGHMAILMAIWAAKQAHGGYVINEAQAPQTYNHHLDEEVDAAFDDELMPFSV